MITKSLVPRLRRIVSLVFTALSLSVTAEATTTVSLADRDLITSAVAIVVGEVTAIESHEAPDGQIFTHVTVDVEDVVHGDLPRGPLTLKQLGGAVGDRTLWIEGSPEFFLGERALLFLRKNADGTLRVAHLYQGKFSVFAHQNSGLDYAYQQPPDGVNVVAPPSGAALAPSVRLRQMDDFKREIRQLRRGRGPRASHADTVTAPTAPAGSMVSSTDAFTYLGTPSRWFEPDAGLPVRMMTNVSGEPAAPGLGFDAVRAAFAAWSSVPGSSFRFEDGGFTSSVGFRSDGVSAISFRDPLGQIDAPTGCRGTLAIGGYSRGTSESRVVNGQTFLRIQEGDVVIADGWTGCGFYENLANFAEVLTHELGHAIGLGHSADSAATMAPFAHFDGRGASLGSDDTAAMAFIYPGTAPALTLSFVNPTHGGTVTGTTTVSLNATGGTGLTYTVTVDGTTAYSGSNPTFSWNTSGLTNGSHALVATVRDSASRTATANATVTVNNVPAPTLTLTFGGTLRDRVGRGATALGADGAVDGTFTVRLNAGSGPRTVTSLELRRTGGGVWDTIGTSIYWALGVATGLDATLTNGSDTSVTLPVADGSTFMLFAANSSPDLFAVGSAFTLTARFADGATATAAVTVAAPTPPAGTVPLTLSYDGVLRDRIGRGAFAVGPDGAMDGVFTARLGAGSGPRTITSVELRSNTGGIWDTVGTSIYWVLGVAPSLDAPLANGADTNVTLPVADGGAFTVFASTWPTAVFTPGTSFTLTARFADGGSATATVTVATSTPTASTGPLTLTYDGVLRDRIGRGAMALGPDGAMDGVFTVRLAAGSGPRTVTALELRSSTGGTWDTVGGSIYWVLGVASSLDAPLANGADTGVALPVADGGAFTVFASTWPTDVFTTGTSFTLTARFADDSTAATSVVVGGLAAVGR